MDVDSIFYIYKKTYLNLPNSIKTFLGELYGSIPLEIRFGSNYKEHKKILNHFEHSDKQFQLDYMFNKTYETLFFAYENIPYYTKIFDLHGFRIKDFKSLSDIKKVPFLTKEIISNEIDSLYTDKVDKLIAMHTGGSTFTPTTFYVPLNTSRAKEKAYTQYIFGQIGYRNRDKTLVLRDADTSDKKHEKYWAYENVSHYLKLSANHINVKYIVKMIDAIKKFKPKYIYGYPSSISFFINASKKVGINQITGIKGVILSSEIVFPEEIDKFKKFFGCHILSHYGHTERTSVGFRIDHQPYSFLNSYGLTRIIEDEIVTTSFDNFVMPLINYKTKDFVKGNSTFIEKSDVVQYVEDIEGRMQEYLVTKNGTLRSVMSIGIGHFDGYKYIEAAQYYQDKPGHLTIHLQSKYPEQVDTLKIIRDLEDFVKHEISFDVKFIDNIKKTPRGKWKSCIQKLNIEQYK